MDSEPAAEDIWAQEKLTVRQEYHRLLIKNGLDVLKSLTGMRFRSGLDLRRSPVDGRALAQVMFCGC